MITIRDYIPIESQPAWQPSTLRFLEELVRTFRPALNQLLEDRENIVPTLAFAASGIRYSQWLLPPQPSDLQCRHVEITGPAERKIIINALNSGADTFLADFEDSLSPTWKNIVEGQQALKEAVDGTIELTASGKHYSLNAETATLMVRPRGLHLVEQHILVDGEAAPAALVDFGVYLANNIDGLLEKGSGAYFYLPKLENHKEAAFWYSVFSWTCQQLGIPPRTIRATVLIETLPAVFQMDEILHSLGEFSSGLNCGRWDYIFSRIKTLPTEILPDRSQLSMTQPFMNAYASLVVQTCHRRGVPAIGGMSALIPIKNDPKKNAEALQRVKEDKIREAELGFAGAWVAHPGLVPTVKDVFKNASHIPKLEDVTEDQLLAIPSGTITMEGFYRNLTVTLQYLSNWLNGTGCVPMNNMMEDLATAEISRAQLWQWVNNKVTTDNGEIITPELFLKELFEIEKVAWTCPKAQAASILRELVLSPQMPKFITEKAYYRLTEDSNAPTA